MCCVCVCDVRYVMPTSCLPASCLHDEHKSSNALRVGLAKTVYIIYTPYMTRVGQIRICIIIRIYSRYIRRIFPVSPRRIRIPYFRISVLIRRIYGNIRRISVLPYFFGQF